MRTALPPPRQRIDRALRARDVPLDPPGLDRVEALLGCYPNIRPAPGSELLGSEERELACSTWLVREGLYQLPTIELVDWLRRRIAGRQALEICAGHGWLGDALEVHSTDGFVFERPALRAREEFFGKQNCRPRPRVERLDAVTAVQKYQPAVVFGCYVTHHWCPKTRTGSDYGVDDAAIFRVPSVRTYILVGVCSTHRHRPFLRRPHETFEYPWLFSRGESPRIWVWEKG